jgi:hypothetical protein
VQPKNPYNRFIGNEIAIGAICKPEELKAPEAGIYVLWTPAPV